jgi:hypothetical protein
MKYRIPGPGTTISGFADNNKKKNLYQPTDPRFFWQASGWINKTLLLIKQQKWLSEFCVKIDRVASKN